MTADETRDVEALVARLYAQRDLLPSRITNPHARGFSRADAVSMARAILASDWLAEHDAEVRAEAEAKVYAEWRRSIFFTNSNSSGGAR